MNKKEEIIQAISKQEYLINYFNIEKDEDVDKICNIGRALSSPIRLQILSLLNRQQKKMIDIAKELNIQPSSAAFHLQILEEANLIKVENNGNKGTNYYSYNDGAFILLQTRDIPKIKTQIPPFVISIPIGDYIDAKVDKDCGMANETNQIMGGSPNNIFIPSRHSAKIIWSSNSCYFEYAIPNDYTSNGDLSSISFSLELCSEARGYNPNFPSDITFSINGIEVCTYTSLGDYGDRYGTFTPEWWYTESTKYGVLVNIYINNNGVYLNEKLITKKINLKSLNLDKGNRTSFKIEVKKDAKNIGGINIFGKKFGDFNQDILFMAKYKSSDSE